LKGEPRPINSELIRAENLLATGYVGAVIIFEDLTPLELIKHLKPNYIVKGAEYANKDFPEKKFIEEYGGIIKYVSEIPGFSTTSVIDKFLK
jgi:bifunctional ADP-heptose synthase (sugar kinase/adenylyltransferase)